MTRSELGDDLGCHPDVQTGAWSACAEIMAESSDVDESKAEYWLDVEFVEPYPEGG